VGFSPPLRQLKRWAEAHPTWLVFKRLGRIDPDSRPDAHRLLESEPTQVPPNNILAALLGIEL